MLLEDFINENFTTPAVDLAEKKFKPLYKYRQGQKAKTAWQTFARKHLQEIRPPTAIL